MANSVDLIIGSEAIKQVENLISKLNLADAELIKVSQSAILASKGIAGISTPTGLEKSVSGTKGLNSELEKQNNIIKALEAQILKLKEAKLKLNAATLQEKVDARITLQNATAEAKAVSNLTGSYQKLDYAHKQATRSAQDIAVKYGSTSREFKTAADKANILDRELKKIDATLGKSQRNVGNYQSAFNGVGSALGAFGVVTGVAGVAMLATNIFNTTKELQSLEMALKQVSGSEAELATNQAFLSRISEAYGAEIKGLTRQFTQFYVSAKDKLSGNEIQGIFESITKAAGVMGLSVENQQRAFLAMNQMMSKGTIQAEELRGQLGEALPGAFGIMAKAVGVSEKELAKMMKAGDLIAAETLPKFAKELEKVYGIETLNRVETLSASQTRLGTKWTEFIGSLNNGGGKLSNFLKGTLDVLNSMVKAMTDFNDTYSSIREKEAAKSNEIDGKIYQGLSPERKKAIATENKEAALWEVSTLNEELKKAKKDFDKYDKISFGNLFNTSKLDQAKKDIEKYNKALGVERGRIMAADEAMKSLLAVKKEVSNEDKKSKSEIKAEKDRLKNIEESLKATYGAELSNLQLKKELIKDEVNLKKGSVDEQIMLSMKLASAEIAIAERVKKEKLRISGNSYKENSNLKSGTLETPINNDFTKDKGNAIQEGVNRIGGIYASFFKETASDFKEGEDAWKLFIDKHKLTPEQEESLNEYNAKIKQQLEETQNYFNSFISDFASNSGFGETLKLFSTEFDFMARTAKEKAVAIMEAFQEMGNFIANQSQARFDGEKQRLQDQYDLSIGFAGDSTAAKEKLANDLEKKQKQIANRENKAKKQQALFNIAVDIAQAIVASLDKWPAGIPMTIAIGLIGAVQLAMVASQKVPQYKDGTQNHKGGLMLVNDGTGSKFQEKVITPDGQEFTPQGRNVLIDAPKGTKVLNHEQQIHEMLNERGVTMNRTIQNNGMTASEMDSIMDKHFSKIQTNVTNFDRNGFSSYTERNGNRTINHNNRVSRTGFKV